MEELLASISQKPLNTQKGQQVQGEIISINEREIIVDLGVKSDGTLPMRELTVDQASSLKIGDTIEAFVVDTDRESGQIILSTHVQAPKPTTRGRGQAGMRVSPAWNKLDQAKRSNNILKGQSVDLNKGGLIIEVDGIRGFLPSSQIGAEVIVKASETGKNDLGGQPVSLSILEVDQQSNRLIFSQKGQQLTDFPNYENGQKVTGTITMIYPFGCFVMVNSVPAIILNTEAAWERIEDLNNIFKVGQEIEALIVNTDRELGRLGLSVRALQEDPFAKIAEKYQTDDVISGVISSVSPSGVTITLEAGVEGSMAAAKMEAGQTYTPGDKISLLVEGIDMQKRRINVAPLITTTKGLIYK